MFTLQGRGKLSAMTLFADAAAQAGSLDVRDHRPWPLDSRPWVMGQSWHGLLFAHWRVDADRLRPHVPAALELEEWDGSAWLAITPFRLTGLRLRGLPPVPLLSSFFELNCRTYVRRDDRPGIWFFSLDASSRLAVEAARRAYRLPYKRARVTAGEWLELERLDGDASFRGRWQPTGPVETATPGTLEYFLAERYCLYGGDGDLRAEIHHPPWPLQRAEAKVEQVGIAPVPLDGEPLCHYASRQDVVVWPPDAIGSPGVTSRAA